MPLSVTLDHVSYQQSFRCGYYLYDRFYVSLYCTLIAGRPFFFIHLLLIAWESYMALAKWMEYKAIVTTGRLNKYTKVAWLLAILIVVSIVVMGAVSVPYVFLIVIGVI